MKGMMILTLSVTSLVTSGIAHGMAKVGAVTLSTESVLMRATYGVSGYIAKQATIIVISITTN